jgi:P-type E1-E2 ATPase
VAVGDTLVIYPHDICPVDGVVIEGHGVMDESYLTGEPFQITKTSGSTVISGAINGESALTIRTTKRAADSRYAKIMEVMRESEAKRPQLRRLGDRLGAIYTPVALTVAVLAWAISGESIRFLAVLVIATPCPLLSRSRSPSSARFPFAPAGRSSSRAPSCSSRSPSVAPRFSTRPGR